MYSYFDISGDWTLHFSRQSSDHCIPIQLPGDSYSALIEAGIMSDPYYADNELACRWTEDQEWKVSRSFELSEDFLKLPHILLYLESIDTIADVYINGKCIAKHENMFFPLKIDIKAFVTVGGNTITLHFPAYTNYIASIKEKFQDSWDIPHTQHDVQFQHRNFLRKVQCHAGWDWAPCLMVNGVYGKMYLHGAEHGYMHYLSAAPCQNSKNGSVWELKIQIEYEAFTEGNTSCSIELKKDAFLLKESMNIVLHSGINSIEHSITVDDPEIWWPLGYGEQPLYTLSANIHGEGQERQVGFRTIELISEIDKHGRSFLFSVNGQEVFIKGANWIPNDGLPSRQTDERYTVLLEDTVAANINMLRIWGGGQYERDIFYKLCNEKGILIWQDFMFSCALYPSHPDFLENVRKEVVYQVKRLKSHPALALWCGNNENLGALHWFDISREHRDKYIIDYDRLNEGVIGTTVRNMDTERVFWPSSPSGGSNDYSMKFHDDSTGDMHYWSVFHERKPFSAYTDITPRFCSEFGFQSFPLPDSIQSYTPKEEQNLTSPIMDHHQRHPSGNAIIIEQLAKYFRFPHSSLDRMLYLSQIQQALAISTAIEFWRCQRPICMGTMYWQLNETWPGCSWSSIEYNGSWKALHYTIRRCYESVQTFALYHKDVASAYVVNDQMVSVEGDLVFEHIGFDGKSIWRETKRVTIPAASAKQCIQRSDVQPKDGFVISTFCSSNITRSGWNLLTLPKYCKLKESAIEYTIDVITTTAAGSTGKICLKSKNVALYTFVQLPNTRFSDNLLLLLPAKEYTITFHSSMTELAQIENELVVNDLYTLCYS